MKNTHFSIHRCTLDGVHAVEANSDKAFARHTHDQFGIGVIQRGAQKSRSGRGMVEAGVGHTITVNPGEVHDGVPIGDNGRAWRMLYIDPALVATSIEDIRRGANGNVEFSLPVIMDARIAIHVLKLFLAVTTRSRANSGADSAILQEELLLNLLAEVMCEQSDMDRARGSAVNITHARSLIDDDPLASITLADLAVESGLSRFQVLRGFSRATGLTPHAYLVQRRIHLARRLIAGGLPLAEAAAASGFADQSHMTRLFVRNYGMSPRIYADGVGYAAKD